MPWVPPQFQQKPKPDKGNAGGPFGIPANAPAPSPAPPQQAGWGGGSPFQDSIAKGGAYMRGEGPRVAPPATPETPGILEGQGQREQFFGDVKGQFLAPQFGEQFAQQAAQQGMAQMGPQNVANQYFQQYQNQIGQDPGLGAYYDRAKGRASADINQQLASRGAYGSSVGLGMVGDALGGLEAQRAKEEADYMLSQQQLGGNLAGQAASSMLGWSQGLGGLGLAADRNVMQRLGQGVMGAQAADAGMLDREQMMYDQIFGLTGMGAQAMGPAMQQQIGGDQAILDAILGGQIAAGAQGVSEAEANEAARKAKVATAMTMGTGIGGMFGGGGGG